MAVSSFSNFRFAIIESLWVGRLLGGVARPPDLAPTLLDIVFLRELEGMGKAREVSPASLTAAATAATLAALADTLFRRVTRCVGLNDPADTESE